MHIFSTLTELFKSTNSFMEAGSQVYSFENTFQISKNRSETFLKKGIKRGEKVPVICGLKPSTIFDIFALWLIGATPYLISDKEPESEIKRKKSEVENSNFFSKEPTIIFFTSGSTGNPKAVVHTLENLINSAKASVEFYGIDSEDRYLVTLPLNHVGGLIIFIRALFAKCTCIFPEKDFKNYKPTILSLVPTQLLRIKDEDFLKNTKVILLGGNGILDSLTPKIKELPISLTYGMTESAAQVAASKPFTEDMAILPGREVKISSDGLILIKGGMGKYLNQKENLDAEGFFHTSDSGVFENGFLRVLGRMDNIFIRGGENISPNEIEEKVMKIQDISFAKVLPIKDKSYGHVPILFYSANRFISDEEFTRVFSLNLPPFKIPKQYIKVPEIFEFKWNKRDLLKYYEASLH